MKMPEPIGWGNHGQIDNINLGHAYIYPAEGVGAHRPVYDKQALIDLLEAAAVECESEQATYEARYKECTDKESRGECVGRIQMAYERARAIRSMKEKL